MGYDRTAVTPFLLRLDNDLHRRVKLAAAHGGESMQDVAERGVRAEVERLERAKRREDARAASQ